MKNTFIMRLAVTTMAAVAICNSAFAAENTAVTASAEIRETGVLDIKVKNAQFESVEGFLNVVVALSDEVFSSLPTSNVMYKTIAVDPEHGTASLQLTIPESFKSGQYYITTADDTDKPYKNILGFVGSDFNNSLLTEVNGASNVDDMWAVLEVTDKFDFCDTLLHNYGREAANYVFSQKPRGGYTDGRVLIDRYIEGEAVARLLTDDVKMSEIIRIYSPHLGMEKLEKYDALTETVKTEVDSLVKKSDSLKTMSFELAFEDMVRTAGFKCAADHDVLATDYIDYATANGISLDAYNKLSDYSKDSVFLFMEDSIKTALCMETVNSAFAAAVSKETTKASASLKSDGNSGGGGGGGRVAVPSAETPIPQKEPNYSASQQGNSVFSDISGHWAEEYITKMNEQGIVSGIGDGSFAPDRSVTRAEFVKMICVMNGVSGGTDGAFKDINTGDWYYKYVIAAYSAGLINGVGDGSFAPDRSISREDAAVIISRVIKTKQMNNSSTFADYDKISDYAREAVGLLVAAGVVKGDDKGNFNPQNAISRGETAALLVRMQENAE